MSTGKSSSEDEIIWHPDKKGLFKVKSAYHLAMELQSSDEASQSDRSKTSNEWKSLWKTGVLPRIKICTWKIVNDVIPSKTNILNKGIDLNPLYTIYLKNIESIPHLIWECKMAKQMCVGFIPKDYWS